MNYPIPWFMLMSFVRRMKPLIPYRPADNLTKALDKLFGLHGSSTI